MWEKVLFHADRMGIIEVKLKFLQQNICCEPIYL